MFRVPQFKIDAKNQAGRDENGKDDNADIENPVDNVPAPIDLDKFQELVKRFVYPLLKLNVSKAVLVSVIVLCVHVPSSIHLRITFD